MSLPFPNNNAYQQDSTAPVLDQADTSVPNQDLGTSLLVSGTPVPTEIKETLIQLQTYLHKQQQMLDTVRRQCRCQSLTTALTVDVGKSDKTLPDTEQQGDLDSGETIAVTEHVEETVQGPVSPQLTRHDTGDTVTWLPCQPTDMTDTGLGDLERILDLLETTPGLSVRCLS